MKNKMIQFISTLFWVFLLLFIRSTTTCSATVCEMHRSGDCPQKCPEESSGNNQGYFVSWLGYDSYLRKSIKNVQVELFRFADLHNIPRLAIISLEQPWNAHMSFHYFCCHGKEEELRIKQSLEKWFHVDGNDTLMINIENLKCNYRYNHDNNENETMIHFGLRENTVAYKIASDIQNIMTEKANVPVWNDFFTKCPKPHITIASINPKLFPVSTFFEYYLNEKNKKSNKNPTIEIIIRDFILSGSSINVGSLFV